MSCETLLDQLIGIPADGQSKIGNTQYGTYLRNISTIPYTIDVLFRHISTSRFQKLKK